MPANLQNRKFQFVVETSEYERFIPFQAFKKIPENLWFLSIMIMKTEYRYQKIQIE